MHSPARQRSSALRHTSSARARLKAKRRRRVPKPRQTSMRACATSGHRFVSNLLTESPTSDTTHQGASTVSVRSNSKVPAHSVESPLRPTFPSDHQHQAMISRSHSSTTRTASFSRSPRRSGGLDRGRGSSERAAGARVSPAGDRLSAGRSGRDGAILIERSSE